MLRILKTTRGVSEPSIYDDGNALCLEYSPDEKDRWVQPTRFCLQRDTAHGTPYFMALFPGLGDEPLDTHVSDAVIARWHKRCGVIAFVLFA